MAWWPVERREGLRLALGARGSLAARGGYVNPASKGARWCPGASRRSTPSRGSRGIGKARARRAARMHRLGCFKFESEIGNAPTHILRRIGPRLHARACTHLYRGTHSAVIPALRLRRRRERSRALARGPEGWPRALVAHPSRL